MSLKDIKTNVQRERGFTIVELLIVIVVIAILAAITIVAYNGVTARANTTSAKATASTVAKKAEAFNAETGAYPTATTDLTGAASSTSYNLPSSQVTFVTPYSSLVAAPSDSRTAVFLKCGSGTPANQAAITGSNITGNRIYYWDYTNSNASSYVDAGITSGTGIACPTAAT